MKRNAVSRTTIVLTIAIIIIIAASSFYVLSIQSPTTNQSTSTVASYKVAAILPGFANEADYNTLGYLALGELHNSTGVQTAYAENVAVPDAATKMEQFIGNGYNVIWAHGAQFNTAIGLDNGSKGLASKYPKVVFIAETDAPVKNQRSNVWIIDRNFAIGYYAIGEAAALASKTGKIAYIGGVQLPFSNAEANAAILAARSVNPSIQVYRYWSNDFNDPVGAKTQAQSMMSLGIDVIMSSTNLGVFGIMQALNGTNVLLTTKYTDKSSYAPSNYITSYEYDFGVALAHAFTQIQKGVDSGFYVIPFGLQGQTAGCFIQLPLHNVSSTVNDKVTTLVNQLISGTIKVQFNSTAPGPGP